MVSIIRFFKKLFVKKEVGLEIEKPEVKIPREDIPLGDFLGIELLPRVKSELASAIKDILAHKGLYMSVESVTGVPWKVVAACHYRESSLSFLGVLHNGELIIGTNRKTKLVPSGRGPFLSWHEAAIDAMEMERNKFPTVWDLQGQLDFCERYNGLGYKKKGIPSPYVYAGTNKYTSGLYVADGKFNSAKVDMRLGCASIIIGLSKLT